jgi:hypothetical protein
MHRRPSHLAIAAILILFSTAIASAQDVQKNVPYVCNGERIVIDSCNMRDLSDGTTCMVGHPDTVLPNGLMKYTTETRGALKKLLPTCKQPTADQLSRAKAFEKQQEDTYNANVKKASDENDAIEARAQQVITGKKSKTPEEAAINRCITSGRLPATCTGNLLLKSFEGFIGQLATGMGGGAPAAPPAGVYVGGNFIGKGDWRLEFEEGAVNLRCGGLDLDQYAYALSLKNSRVSVAVKTDPKTIVFEEHPDSTWSDAASVIVNGRVKVGSRAVQGTSSYDSGTYRDGGGNYISKSQADTLASSGGQATHDGATYSGSSSSSTPTTAYVPVYAPKTVTCGQALLTSKGAAPSAIDMGTGLLKNMFSDGEKGPVAPAGLRMHGSYGGDGGILLEFYPESAVISCGEAAHAYPYVVRVDGSSAVVDLQDPARILTFPLMPDGQLNASPGPYEVRGRSIIGQNDAGDFNFSPLSATCNLSTLKAGATPGRAPAAAAPPSLTIGNPSNATLSSPGAPTGNAVLNITSGFPAQPGVPNPLAGRPMVILRTDYDSALRAAGITIPPGTAGAKLVANTCPNPSSPDCQKALNAIKTAAASAIRGDANGAAALPGVPAGPYYLMISALYKNQILNWSFKVDLKPGPNNLVLDPHNATPPN